MTNENNESTEQKNLINNLENPYETSIKLTQKPIFAGILLIIGGIFALITYLPLISGDELLFSNILTQTAELGLPEETIRNFFFFCGVIGEVISILMILGGVIALKRKIWSIPFVCSLLGLLSLGIFFTSSFASFIAMVLLFLSRKEFENKKII